MRLPMCPFHPDRRRNKVGSLVDVTQEHQHHECRRLSGLAWVRMQGKSSTLRTGCVASGDGVCISELPPFWAACPAFRLLGAAFACSFAPSCLSPASFSCAGSSGRGVAAACAKSSFLEPLLCFAGFSSSYSCTARADLINLLGICCPPNILLSIPAGFAGVSVILVAALLIAKPLQSMVTAFSNCSASSTRSRPTILLCRSQFHHSCAAPATADL